MINTVALLFLGSLVAIPAGAVLAAYREEWQPAYRKLAQAMKFDPRHPAIAYEAATDRISNQH
jgi:hypothetical protein